MWYTCMIVVEIKHLWQGDQKEKVSELRIKDKSHNLEDRECGRQEQSMLASWYYSPRRVLSKR